jgi:two-component system, OmpR family, KDP operon response regulator KdpE
MIASRASREGGARGLHRDRYPPRVTGPPVTVLVVDDDPSLRLLCRVNLQLDGYTVLEAGTIAAAEEVLEREKVDVVLLDVHIGTDDGRRLLTHMREREHGARVALFTGSSPTLTEAVEGADALVTKPFTLETLSSTVRQLSGRGAKVR